MKLGSFEDLLVHEIKVLRGAEKQLSVVFGRLSLQCSSSELFLFLQAQAARCFGRGRVLKDVARMLDRKCSPKLCGPMMGVAEEARIVVSKTTPGSSVLDVALLLVADRTAAYLSSSYDGARTLALRRSAAVAALLDGCRRDLLEGSEGFGALLDAALEASDSSERLV